MHHAGTRATPGLSQAAIQAIVDRTMEAVGPDDVLDADDVLVLYSGLRAALRAAGATELDLGLWLRSCFRNRGRYAGQDPGAVEARHRLLAEGFGYTYAVDYQKKQIVLQKRYVQ